MPTHKPPPPSNSLVSAIQPWRSNGYISWIQEDGFHYNINIHQIVNGTSTLISTKSCSTNYYKFDSSMLTSTDLQYSISKTNSSGRIIETSQPQPIGPIPPPSVVCYNDCSTDFASYRINFMKREAGGTFLMASEA